MKTFEYTTSELEAMKKTMQIFREQQARLKEQREKRDRAKAKKNQERKK